MATIDPMHRILASSLRTRSHFWIAGKHCRPTRTTTWRCCLSTTTSQAHSGLPVGIFIDLDNVAPEKHDRRSVREFTQPFRLFAQIVNRGIDNNTTTEKARRTTMLNVFANRATQTFRPPDEREAEFEQDWQEWDGSSAATGFDDDDKLRCGVCGAIMKITKKNAKAGITPEDKLRKHMKSLHDREQAKRINYYLAKTKRGRKKRPKMSEKEFTKYKKYKSAQVGLSRLGIKRGPTNELLRVLGEQDGVKCYSSEHVDQTLERSASRWMNKQKMRRSTETGSSNQEEEQKKGILMIVSEDSDFAPLLERARAEQFWAVSATHSMEQTEKLVQASHMVLRRKQPYTQDETLKSVLRSSSFVIQPSSDEAIEWLRNVTSDQSERDGASAEDHVNHAVTFHGRTEKDGIDEEEYRGDSLPPHLRQLLNVKITPYGLVNRTPETSGFMNKQSMPNAKQKDGAFSEEDVNHSVTRGGTKEDWIDEEEREHDGRERKHDDNVREEEYRGDSLPPHQRQLSNVNMNKRSKSNEDVIPYTFPLSEWRPEVDHISRKLKSMTSEEIQDELQKRDLLKDEDIVTKRVNFKTRLRRVYISDIVKARLDEYANLPPVQKQPEEFLYDLIREVFQAKRKRPLFKMATMVHFAEQDKVMPKFDDSCRKSTGTLLEQALAERGIEGHDRRNRNKNRQLLIEALDKERADHTEQQLRVALQERGERTDGDLISAGVRLARSLLGKAEKD